MEISPTWMSLSFYYNTFCLIYISTRFGNPLMMNELKNKLKKTPKESGDDWQDLFSHWWTMVHEQWVLIYHKYLSILFQTFICLFLLNIFVWTFTKKINIFLFWTVFTCSRGFLKTGVIKKKLTAQGIKLVQEGYLWHLFISSSVGLFQQKYISYALFPC